jgi:hypothetical protein
MTQYRILVTGSRDWAYPLIIKAYFDQMLASLPLRDTLLLVHGACLTGADRITQVWAKEHGVPTERHPASEHGVWPSCGPRRNAHMVSLGADRAVGFIGSCMNPTCTKPYQHGSHGATGCLQLARDAGILCVAIRVEYL